MSIVDIGFSALMITLAVTALYIQAIVYHEIKTGKPQNLFWERRITKRRKR